MTQTAAAIFRKYEIPNVPASGPHEPAKQEVIDWGTMLESLLNGSGTGLAYANLGALLGDLAHPANSTAIVYNDAGPPNNGLYVKSGASGSGTWTRFGDLPNSVIRLTVTGGTGNAIVATAPEEPSLPGNKLFLLTPTATNTGPTTLARNGGAAATILNALASSLAANSLVANSPVLMLWQVDHYQLLVSLPVDATGILNDAIAARDAASGYATAAASSASALGNQVHQYDTRAQAIAATIPVGVTNVIVKRRTTGAALGNAPYIPGTIAGPDAFQEAGGHYWQLDLTGGLVKASWFGAKTGTDSTAAFQACIDALKANGFIPIEVEPGTYIITSQLNAVSTLTSVFTPAFKMRGAGQDLTIFDNRVSGTSLSSVFSTSNGSVIVTMAWPSHGKAVGDCFTLRNCSRSATVTMTIASPCVVTWTAHGITEGGDVVLSTTGALPTGVPAGRYYAINVNTNTFQLAATPGGTPINTSGTQSGTHTGKTDRVGNLDMNGSWAVASVPDANTITFLHWGSANANASALGSVTVNKAMLKIGAAASKYQRDGYLTGFSITTTTAPAGSTGIELRSAYNYAINIAVANLSGDGICIPCVQGDPDGGNQISIDGRVDSCGGWGWIVDNRSHNEVSDITIGGNGGLFVQSCGTPSLFTCPPSGGGSWKGQGCALTHYEAAVCYNTSLHNQGGANDANGMTGTFVALENTIGEAAWTVEGAVGARIDTLQIYQNNSFIANYGIKVNGMQATVRNVRVGFLIIRAPSGVSPYTLLYNIPGNGVAPTRSNAETKSLIVDDIYFLDFNYAGQKISTGFAGAKGRVVRASTDGAVSIAATRSVISYLYTQVDTQGGGIWNGTNFTADRDMNVRVSASVGIDSLLTTNTVTIQIEKNSVAYSTRSFKPTLAAGEAFQITDIVPLLAGEIVTIAALQNSGSAKTLAANAAVNTVAIEAV
jgi:hypothetical protein